MADVFGVSVGDLIAVALLAAKVYEGLSNAEEDFQNAMFTIEIYHGVIKEVEKLLEETQQAHAAKTDPVVNSFINSSTVNGLANAINRAHKTLLEFEKKLSKYTCFRLDEVDPLNSQLSCGAQGQPSRLLVPSAAQPGTSRRVWVRRFSTFMSKMQWTFSGVPSDIDKLNRDLTIQTNQIQAYLASANHLLLRQANTISERIDRNVIELAQQMTERLAENRPMPQGVLLYGVWSSIDLGANYRLPQGAIDQLRFLESPLKQSRIRKDMHGSTLEPYVNELFSSPSVEDYSLQHKLPGYIHGSHIMITDTSDVVRLWKTAGDVYILQQGVSQFSLKYDSDRILHIKFALIIASYVFLFRDPGVDGPVIYQGFLFPRPHALETQVSIMYDYGTGIASDCTLNATSYLLTDPLAKIMEYNTSTAALAIGTILKPT